MMKRKRRLKVIDLQRGRPFFFLFYFIKDCVVVLFLLDHKIAFVSFLAELGD
jgi:hypothetical protein